MRRQKERQCLIKFDFGEWPVLGIDWGTFHCVKSRVSTIYDLSDDCIFAVEMRLLCVSNEKLRLVRVWARVGHCD